MERHFNPSRNGNQDDRPIAAEADSQNWLRGMHRKINRSPTLLSETAGKDTCCIFRVPQSLVEINEKAYKPRIVSIGPYHHGQEHLSMIQEHKWRFLRTLLARKEDESSILSHCFQVIASVETEIRECYSDQTSCAISNREFVEMMVLDGIFIIELVCKFTDLAPKDPNDPIFKMDWITPFLMRDLLKLENQIPFRVLQLLFDTLEPNSRKSFAHLALKFFGYMLERPTSVLEGAHNFRGAHLLDLVRLSFLPSAKGQRDQTREALLQFIQPAEKLHRAGIQFKTRSNSDSFLDLKFRNGVLKIPALPMDDFISSFLLNCVAFEQCYGRCAKFITDYATVMGCLIHTPSDAGFLCDHKIIQNCFGSDEQVACFFSNIGKDVAIDIRKSYLSKLVEDVNEYYWNDWHVRWAGFKHKYFDSPWSFMSACAALLLLILTTIQTFFTVLAYVHPSSS